MSDAKKPGQRSGPPPAPRSTALPADKPDPAALAAAAEAEALAEQQALAELGGPAADDETATPAEPALGRARTVEEDAALKARVEEYRAKWPGLSDDDIREALGIAHDEIEEQRRQNAIKALIAAEKRRLKLEEGLVTGVSVLDEMVEVEIDCQPWQSPIVLGGVGYYRGETYKVPRHVGNMILELCDRGRRADRDIRGESWEDFYRRPHQTVLSAVKGVVEGGLDQRVAA